MSQSTPEMKLEVEVFERLERYTSLTLGQINMLRRKSRETKQDLLTVALQDGAIDRGVAQRIAHELMIPDPTRPKANPHFHRGISQPYPQGSNRMGGSAGFGTNVGVGSNGLGHNTATVNRFGSAVPAHFNSISGAQDVRGILDGQSAPAVNPNNFDMNRSISSSVEQNKAQVTAGYTSPFSPNTSSPAMGLIPAQSNQESNISPIIQSSSNPPVVRAVQPFRRADTTMGLPPNMDGMIEDRSSRTTDYEASLSEQDRKLPPTGEPVEVHAPVDYESLEDSALSIDDSDLIDDVDEGGSTIEPSGSAVQSSDELSSVIDHSDEDQPSTSLFSLSDMMAMQAQFSSSIDETGPMEDLPNTLDDIKVAPIAQLQQVVSAPKDTQTIDQDLETHPSNGEELSSDSTLALGEHTFDHLRLRIDEHIDRYGSWNTYRAHDIGMNRPICLITHQVDDVDESKQKHTDFRTLTTHHFTWTPTVYAKYKYQTLELILLSPLEGASLPDQIEHKTISWITKVKIWWQLCYMTACVHQKGLHHLNLSPYAFYGTPESLSLWGWYGVESNDVTSTLSTNVFRRFLAPERRDGVELISPACADVYSLGAIGLWLLSGALPPEGTDQCIAQLDAYPSWPKRWVEVCKRALRRDAYDRPADGLQFYQMMFGVQFNQLRGDPLDRDTLEHSLDAQQREHQLFQLFFESRVDLRLMEIFDPPPFWKSGFDLSVVPLGTLELEKTDSAQSISIYYDCSEIASSLESNLINPGVHRLTWYTDEEAFDWELLIESHETRSFNLLAFNQRPLGQTSWHYLPSGPAFIGSRYPKGDELPLHRTESPSVYIKKERVTVAEYQCFLDTLSAEDLAQRTPCISMEETESTMSILGISMEDAQAYCQWVGDGAQLLPEPYWEKLLRGESAKEQFDIQSTPRLADAFLDGGELCINSQLRAVVKGGESALRRPAARMLLQSNQKMATVGFRYMIRAEEDD